MTIIMASRNITVKAPAIHAPSHSEMGHFLRLVGSFELTLGTSVPLVMQTNYYVRHEP